MKYMSIFSKLKQVITGRSNTDVQFLNYGSYNTSMTTRASLNEYRRYVYTIVSAIAADFAKIEPIVERQTADGYEPVKNHPLLKLLSKPNPDMSQFQFLEMQQTYYELAGESFCYVERMERSRTPTALYLINPAIMDVAIADDEYGSVAGYVLTKDNGEKVRFEKDEIIHYKSPNPTNPYRGYSPIVAAALYIQTEQLASEWTKNTIFNAGRPSGILHLKGTISDEEFKRIERKFRQDFTGTANAGKTMLFKGGEGASFEKMSVDLGEIELKQLKDLTRDDIMIMYRVSKTMLGVSDDVNRANALEAKQVWIQNVIKPKMDRWADHTTTFLLQTSYGENERVSYIDPMPENEEAKMKVLESKSKLNVLTVNEKRINLGMEPVAGGDVIFVPTNLAPFDPKAKPTTPEKSVTKAKDSIDTAEEFRLGLFKNQEKWEKKYEQELIKIFDKQETEILGKTKTKQSLSEFDFDSQKYLQEFVLNLYPLSLELMKEQGDFVFDFIQETELDFDPNARLSKLLKEHIERFAVTVNESIKQELADSILEGIKAGEALPKLRDRVSDVYTDIKKVRAELIARTETTWASNEATNEAYKVSPSVEAKQWYTNPGACQFCGALNGKIVSLSENYAPVGTTITGNDGSKFVVNYESVGHPPLHPNCRCTLLPVTKFNIKHQQKEVTPEMEVLKQIRKERANLEKEKLELDAEVDKFLEIIG